MQALEDWSALKQAPAMMLEVGTNNVSAISLYEKLGYQKISTREGYYGPGLDAFVMRKELKV
jgi:ribosomal-protein-alanine N-acetyltransferase